MLKHLITKVSQYNGSNRSICKNKVKYRIQREVIEAFLPGWHLRVTQDECQIQAFRPLVPVGGSKADGSRKRGRDSDE